MVLWFGLDKEMGIRLILLMPRLGEPAGWGKCHPRLGPNVSGTNCLNLATTLVATPPFELLHRQEISQLTRATVGERLKA
jgi:hypothetical protein